MKRIIVMGGTGFLGFRVVRALLEQEAQVTVVVQPGAEDKLGSLRNKVQWVQGDPWNPASLRGRGRGHAAVIHLVGGIKPDPKRGLTFRHLNYVSARNVAQMAVSDGIPHLLLLSVAAAPLGVPGGYVESKRDAEEYIQSTGLAWTIIRAPALYAPGERRSLAYQILSLIGSIPPLGWLLTSYRSIPVDRAARGIASLALSADSFHNRRIGPHQLERLGRLQERLLIPDSPLRQSAEHYDDSLDDPPFGWLPPVR